MGIGIVHDAVFDVRHGATLPIFWGEIIATSKFVILAGQTECYQTPEAVLYRLLLLPFRISLFT
jgi:hypothetical protein